MSSLSRFIAALSDAAGSLAAVATLILTVMVSSGVIACRVFNAPFLFVEELSSYFVLSIVFLRDAISLRVRAAVTAGVVVVAAAVAPFVQAVFVDAGTEASASSDYRGDLYSLVPGMGILGTTPEAHRGSDGRVFYGPFRSIDSQLVLTGLTFGLLVAGAVLVALAVGVWLVLRGYATAATIALVAQIPALASVALITQYATLVWFLAGVAATSQILRRDAVPLPEPPPDPVDAPAIADAAGYPDPASTTAPPLLPGRTPSR